MAETLASLIDRVEVFLADSNNKSWSTSTITECMRYALNEINQAAGKSGSAAYKIDDLDSATETTLPDVNIEALIVGTSAYCAKNRAVDRMEKPGLGEGPQAGLEKWAGWAESRFNVMLGRIKAAAISAASTAPHEEMTWDEDPHKW